MFNRSIISLIPLYHQRALGVTPKKHWWGNWGYKRFAYRPIACDQITLKTVITSVDRDNVNYMHKAGVRQWVMYRRGQWNPSNMRSKRFDAELSRRRHRKISKSMQAFMQYKIMTLMKDQASSVNKYGQAAVNTALGDGGLTSPAMDAKRHGHVLRRARAPPVSSPVIKHIATMRQRFNDRFNMKPRYY
eukprot:PhM_4_TR11228/c0_g1_i1/m.18347